MSETSATSGQEGGSGRGAVSWIVPLAAFLFVPVGALAPKGEMVVLALAGLALAFVAIHHGHWRRILRTPAAGILAALLVWALVGVLWSSSPGDTLELWKSLVLIFAAGLIALSAGASTSAARHSRVALWSSAGLALGLALLALELTAGMPITSALRGLPAGTPEIRKAMLNPGLSIALIALWPVAAALWRRGNKAVSGALVLAAAGVVMAGDGGTAKLALGVSALVFGLVFWWRGRAVDVLAGLVALSVLLMPLMFDLGVPRPGALDQEVRGASRSALHRVYIWQFTTMRIAERPLTGWGLDSSRSIRGGQDKVLGNAQLMSLHPHNGALQIWLELGAPGALLAAGLIIVAAQSIRRKTRLERASAAATISAALAVAALSFGLWQNWWLAALGLGAMTVSALTASEST